MALSDFTPPVSVLLQEMTETVLCLQMPSRQAVQLALRLQPGVIVSYVLIPRIRYRLYFIKKDGGCNNPGLCHVVPAYPETRPYMLFEVRRLIVLRSMLTLPVVALACGSPFALLKPFGRSLTVPPLFSANTCVIGKSC